MLAPFYFSISFGIAIFFMASSSVQAQNFVLPAGLQASWCSTSWSVSGSTYTCTGGSGKVTFPDNAVISSGSAVVFLANAGFELNNAKLGSVDSKISLRAPNGGGHVKSAAGAEVSGYIETSGTVDLVGTKVGEYIKSSGKVTLAGGRVGGNVESFNSGVSAIGGVVFEGEIKANGDINLVGGSVGKRVTSTDNKVITQGTSLLGGATAKSGMTIRGDGDTIIKGDFVFAALNAAYFEGVKMMSGSSIGTAGTAYFKDSVIGTLTNLVDVRVDGSATVRLENSTIYGMVHVPDYGQWSPLITGDSRSNIYGECLRFSGGTRPLSDPARLCDGSAVPPDPVGPVECGVSLDVGPMIAGKPHYATVTALDEPPSCEIPPVLNFLFNYVNPDPRPGYHNRLPISINGKEIAEGDSEEVSGVEWEGKEAKLTIEYKEAGRLYLALLDANKQVVSESKDNFVSRPYGFCIKPPQAAPILESGIVDFDSLVRFKAGEPFPVSVTAVRWKESGEVYGSLDEPLAAENICDNGATLNYRQPYQTSFLGAPELILPALGVPGVSNGSFKHDPNDPVHPALNGSVNADVTLSEVGFFRITMKEPPTYLGASMSHSISQSAPIGRIIPAWLELGAKPSQNIGCPLAIGGFTYQEQPTFLTGELEVRAFNRVGHRTLNYKDDFWRFTGTLEGSEREGAVVYELYQNSATPVAGQPSAIADRVSAMPVFTAMPANAAFLPSGGYSYTRPATPSALDNPFSLNMVIWNWHDQDGVYFKRDDEEPEDERGFEPTVPMPVVALIGDSEFRLGRVRSENLIVPHGNSAQAPIMLEHWRDTVWQRDFDDCTLLAPPADSAPRFSFDSGLTSADVDEVDEWNQSYLQITDATGPEPEPQGRVLLHHLLQHSNGVGANWLCQQRSEASAPLGGVCSYRDGGDAETRSSITFGIHQGPKPLIFRREVYR